MKIRQLRLGAGFFLLCAGSTVSAMQFEPGVGAGVMYTDNASLTSADEQSDVISVGYLGASILEEGGPLYYGADSTLLLTKYKNDTFGNQQYFNLNGLVGWVQIADRLEWVVRDIFGQRAVDSLDPGTPDNIQDTNIFSIDSIASFQLSPRNQLGITPFFQDFYYETSDTDNQQYGLNASWSYLLNRTMNIGLDGGVTSVNYDNDDDNNENTRRKLQEFITSTRPSSVYTVGLGATYVKTDRGDDQRGSTGSLSWFQEITGHSSIVAYVASDITNTSASTLNSDIDPDTGNPDNEQITGETLRNNIIRITYTRDDETFDTLASVELRDLDYDESLNDRKVQDYNLELDYRATALLTTGMYGRYSKIRETDISRTDKQYTVGGKLRYSFSRKLEGRFNIAYRNKDSDESFNEYSEFSAFVGLVYGFGDVSAPLGRY